MLTFLFWTSLVLKAAFCNSVDMVSFLLLKHVNIVPHCTKVFFPYHLFSCIRHSFNVCQSLVVCCSLRAQCLKLYKEHENWLMQQRLNDLDPSMGDKGSYSPTPMSLSVLSVPRLALNSLVAYKVVARNSQPLDFWVPRLQGMFEPLRVLRSGAN